MVKLMPHWHSERQVLVYMHGATALFGARFRSWDLWVTCSYGPTTLPLRYSEYRPTRRNQLPSLCAMPTVRQNDTNRLLGTTSSIISHLKVIRY
jgi:hypothetical protein